MVFRKIISTTWVLMVCLGSPLLGSVIQFSCDRYVQHNEIIVEGKIVSDCAVEPMEWFECNSGWYFPTNCSAVVVESVLKNQSSLALSAGDTLHFCYPSSNSGKNPEKPEVLIDIEEISPFQELPIGYSSIFPFHEHEQVGLMPGSWFMATDGQKQEIRRLFENAKNGPNE